MAPPARPRERFTSEAIGLGSSAAAAAYATFQEFLHVIPKTIAGTLLATAATVGAYKAWRAKQRE